MSPLSLPLERIRPHYDVLVVGSGYGGGISASRLARAGLRVCVLERGREYPTGSFPARFPEVRGELMVSGGRFGSSPKPGLYDFRYGEHIHVLTGCGLGGGSLVNAGVSLRPDRRVFADPRWPAELRNTDSLEEGFRRAARWIRPTRDPKAGAMRKLQALTEASPALGKPPAAAPVAVSFEDTTNPAGVAQTACTRCGDCCAGCNVGAKNTVAMTYLPDAAAHGAELFCGVRVTHVSRERGRWRVWWRPSPGTAGRAGDDFEPVEADTVVLAAGTLGSTELLLRSREHGLPLSDRLGEGFSANGDIIAFGYNGKNLVSAVGVGHPPRADIGEVGAAVTGEIELDHADDLDLGMYVQEGVLPSALGPLLPVMFVPGGRLLGAAQALLKGVYAGPLARTHTFFVVSHDSAEGRIVLKDGQAAIEWPKVMEQPVYARVDAALDRLCRAVGASYVKNPLSETVMGKRPATAHPLGGSRYGSDRGQGVVDGKGRVFDGAATSAAGVHEGLYVSDGSVMPRSLGVNPLLTISALTERMVMLLAEDRQLRFDIEPRAAASAAGAPA